MCAYKKSWNFWIGWRGDGGNGGDGGDVTITLTPYWNFSKIFLRCTLTPKILKKFTIIYRKNTHICEFFQNIFGSNMMCLGKNTLETQKSCYSDCKIRWLELVPRFFSHRSCYINKKFAPAKFLINLMMLRTKFLKFLFVD